MRARQGRVKSEHHAAGLVAAAFAVAGAFWIVASDTLLYAMTGDRVLVARLETAKGWIFVALTSALLYWVTLRCSAKLVQAQRTLAAVVHSIGDGVLLLGPDRTIAHANPAALRMLGCTDLEELVGMGAQEFSRRFRVSYPDGALVPPSEYASQRVFDEGGPLHYKAVLHVPDKPETVIVVVAAAVRSEVGEPADLVVSVMHDITESEQFERLRDSFFAAAAHSLKTPVAILKANAQLLVRGGSAQRAAESIERQCDRVDRLVQNLLVVARVRSQSLQLYPSDVDLAPLVESIASDMAKDSRRHTLRTEISAAPRVRADEERLSLVLRNMIESAFRSAKQGTALTVLLTQHDGDAEIGLRYEPLPLDELAAEPAGSLDLARSVDGTIVTALGGTLAEDRGAVATTEWVRLPLLA